MKILLVRVPIPRHTMGLKHIMICEPLELEYVAAGLDGHEVQIMDMILERGYEKRLARFQPDVVGTSSYIAGVNEAITFVAPRTLNDPVGCQHSSFRYTGASRNSADRRKGVGRR